MENIQLKDKIIKNYDHFSKREYKVANYVVKNYEHILYMSSYELAEASGVSNSTVVRFAQTLGYKGFLQFRNAVKLEFRATSKPYMSLGSMRKLNETTLEKYFENIKNELDEFARKININAIEEVAKKILEAKKTYLVGIGSDSVMVKYMFEYLNLIGINCIEIVEEGLHLKQKLLFLDKRDFILMAAFPTVQEDEYWVTSYAKETNVDIAVITDSELTAKSLGVETYFTAKLSIDSFYNSNVLVMILCDMLLSKIKELAPDKVQMALRKYDEIISQ